MRVQPVPPLTWSGQRLIKKSLERLSSGNRINSSADDAGG